MNEIQLGLAELSFVDKFLTTFENRRLIYVTSICLGGGLGYIFAKKVSFTSLPETVALMNFFCGLSMLFSIPLTSQIGIWDGMPKKMFSAAIFSFQLSKPEIMTRIAIFTSSITVTASFVVLGKLQGWKGKSWFGYRNIILLLMLLGSIIWGNVLVVIAASLIFGIIMTLPIKSADAPIVIPLLNVFSGISLATVGICLSQNILLITGAIICASGIVIIQVMSKAFNRSLIDVLSGFTLDDKPPDAYENTTSVTVEELSKELLDAQKIVIVPGYGLAVAQAQYILGKITKKLTEKGIEVNYGIHPAAGRMAGHIEVILAEANIPITEFKNVDEINKEIENTDVALVIGANDIVNPQAKTNQDSSIYGLEILDVSKAKNVFFVKRGLNAGYAGLKNDLFDLPNNKMVFGDAKEVLENLMELLDHSILKIPSKFKKGDQIVVTAGPFKDLKGDVIEVFEGQDKLKTNIDIYGRETPVDLEFTQIKRDN